MKLSTFAGLPIDLPDTLHAERDGAVVLVRLARVAKRNALDDATIEGIEALFTHLPEDVRAVVIGAEGEHFSAGLDLSTLAEATMMESMVRSQLWHRTFEMLQF